jgi:hypothetical protein
MLIHCTLATAHALSVCIVGSTAPESIGREIARVSLAKGLTIEHHTRAASALVFTFPFDADIHGNEAIRVVQQSLCNATNVQSVCLLSSLTRYDDEFSASHTTVHYDDAELLRICAMELCETMVCTYPCRRTQILRHRPVPKKESSTLLDRVQVPSMQTNLLLSVHARRVLATNVVEWLSCDL